MAAFGRAFFYDGGLRPRNFDSVSHWLRRSFVAFGHALAHRDTIATTPPPPPRKE